MQLFSKKYSLETQEKAETLRQAIKEDAYFDVWTQAPYDADAVDCLERQLKKEEKNKDNTGFLTRPFVSSDLRRYKQMQKVHGILETEEGYHDERLVELYMDAPKAFIALTQKPVLKNALALLTVAEKAERTGRDFWNDKPYELYKHAAYIFAELGKESECRQALMEYKTRSRTDVSYNIYNAWGQSFRCNSYSYAYMSQVVEKWNPQGVASKQALITMGEAAIRTELQFEQKADDAARQGYGVLAEIGRKDKAAEGAILEIFAQNLQNPDQETAMTLFVKYAREAGLSTSQQTTTEKERASRERLCEIL